MTREDALLSCDVRVAGATPADLAPSTKHVRSAFAVDDQFVRNVENVGLIQPPITRYEEGNLRIVDGVRRTMAAEQAGYDEIPVLVCDLTDAEALEVSLTLNLGVWRSSVSDRDEEAALRFLSGGPRRPLNDWEQSDEVFEAKYALGLVDETDVMLRAVGGADGVGEATALALVEAFGTPDAVADASVEALQRADGVGPKTAQAIRTHFERPAVTVPGREEETDGK